MITSRQLEVFLAVYRTGSITLAARQLYMSQPAVSQVIHSIEAEYGVNLFDRFGHKQHATQAALTLYEYASRIYSLQSELDAELRRNEGVKELAIGANISAGQEQIRRYIHKFHESYPDIRVRVMVFNSQTLEKELYAHRLDMALLEDLIRREDDSSLVTIPYYRDRIVLVAAPDYPLALKEHVVLEDLRNEKLMFRERGAGVRDKFEYILSLNNMHIDPVWECSSSEDIINAVCDHFGAAVLPYLLVKKYIDSGEVKEINIEDVSLTRSLNVVYHKDKVISAPLRSFIDIVLADAGV